MTVERNVHSADDDDIGERLQPVQGGYKGRFSSLQSSPITFKKNEP